MSAGQACLGGSRVLGSGESHKPEGSEGGEEAHVDVGVSRWRVCFEQDYACVRKSQKLGTRLRDRKIVKRVLRKSNERRGEQCLHKRYTNSRWGHEEIRRYRVRARQGGRYHSRRNEVSLFRLAPDNSDPRVKSPHNLVSPG